MVSPKRLATDSTVSSGKELSCGTGMVFVTMTSWKTPELRRSMAGGEKTGCVAQAYTSRAPSTCNTFAAFVIVPVAGEHTA